MEAGSDDRGPPGQQGAWLARNEDHGGQGSTYGLLE